MELEIVETSVRRCPFSLLELTKENSYELGCGHSIHKSAAHHYGEFNIKCGISGCIEGNKIAVVKGYVTDLTEESVVISESPAVIRLRIASTNHEQARRPMSFIQECKIFENLPDGVFSAKKSKREIVEILLAVRGCAMRCTTLDEIIKQRPTSKIWKSNVYKACKDSKKFIIKCGMISIAEQ